MGGVSPRGELAHGAVRGDLAFGVAWFVGFFVQDVIGSLRLIGMNLAEAPQSPDTIALIRWGVGRYLLQVGLAYLLMGLVAGAVLHVLRRLSGPRYRWALRFGWGALLTDWMYARGIIVYPRMFPGGGGLDWFAGHFPLAAVQIGFGALALGALIVQARRHRPHPGWWVALAGLLLLVNLADAQPPAARPRDNEGPNVIIVGFDALRPDHLASFGYHRDTAPSLDRFLAEAQVFDSAFTPTARTWPAWMSILTGTWPWVHGQRASLPAPGLEGAAVPTLPQVLADRGYYTAFLTDDSRFSFMLPSHGFERVDQPPTTAAAFTLSRFPPDFRAFATFLNGPLGWAIAPVYRYNQAFGTTHRSDYFAEHVAEAIAEASRHERFFLAVHSCLLHAPADRSYPYHRMYGMPDAAGDNRYRYRSTGSAAADAGGAGDPAELEALERQSAEQNLKLYDSGLAMVDETWARIARALDEGDLWDNTLVIVLSDHGEDFLEERPRYRFIAPNHGFHPWGVGQHRVLLALAGGGFEAGRRQELASLVDVAPTAARYLGLDWEGSGLPLQDALPERVLLGETGVSEPGYWPPGHRRYSFGDLYRRYTVDPESGRVYGRPEYLDTIVDAKDRFALDSRLWLVEEAMSAGPRALLFDWRADPTFDEDLSGALPRDVARLSAQLPEHGPPAAEASSPR